MDTKTLVASADFARARLIAELDAIERSGHEVAKVLGWRPGPGRAHIAWQAMHCAASHDKYCSMVLKGQPAPADPALVSAFAGGSTPSDDNVPSMPGIRAALERSYADFRAYVQALTPAQLEQEVGPPDRRRKLGDAIVLLAWHEAHHQGQIHLIWNLYKATHEGKR